MINPEKYKIWTKAFSPNSSYIGSWTEGSEITFVDKDRGGTVAHIDKLKPYDQVTATHIATLTADGVRETTGEFTEKWIGTKETYRLEESDGKTVFKVEMQTDPAFEGMFEGSWPQALKDLKKLAEA